MDQQDQVSPKLSPRRVSLLVLPPELLRNIVRMCSEQDQAFQKRRHALWLHQPDLSRLIECQRSRGYGRSLSAIASTCSQLYHLMLPLRFHTLKVLPDSEPPYDRRYTDRHVAQVRHLVVSSCKASRAFDLIAIMLKHLPKVDEVTLTDPITTDSFVWESRVATETGAAAMKERIRKLHVEGSETASITSFLDIFEQVHTLTLDYPGIPKTLEEATKFFDQLGGSKIETLTLNHDDVPSIFLDPSFVYPRLKSLSLSIDDHGFEMVEFVHRFHSTLEVLKIHVSGYIEPSSDDSNRDIYPNLPTDWTFPHVHTLSIDCGRPLAWQLVNPRIFPSVRHLQISLPWGDSEEDIINGDRFLLEFIETRQLESLVYELPKVDDSELIFARYNVELVNTLEEAAFEQGFHLRYQKCPSESFPDYNYKGNAWDPRVEEWEEESEEKVELGLMLERIERVRDYLDKVERMALATNDLPSLKKITPYLCAIEMERLADLE